MSQTLCPRHFVLIFCRTASLGLFLACSQFFFCQNKGFCSYKIALIKKSVRHAMDMEKFANLLDIAVNNLGETGCLEELSN